MPLEQPSTGPQPSPFHPDEVERRLAQQTLVAEFGRFALRSRELDKTLVEACRVAADGLGTSLSKVLEPHPGGESFLLRAGCGWNKGVVGQATVGADLGSPAGYAYMTGEPVISNHLAEEERFRTPQLMAEHGVQRAINVLIRGENEPLGVLEADSRDPGAFSPHDVNFLQALANTLGLAIEAERSRAELERLNAQLTQALADKDMLMREVDHRVKNNLTMVGGMLNMQSRAATSEEVRAVLGEANVRLMTIARIHEQLYRTATVGTVEFGAYLANLAEDIGTSLARADARLTVETDHFDIPVARAVPLGLWAAELVTNALKHARHRSGTSLVKVVCRKSDHEIRLAVGDDGPGLANGFDFTTSKGLGMRLVQSFARQLNGTVTATDVDGGACFLLAVPLTDETDQEVSRT